jgi:DNA-binding NarL/FixJ family response regulator
LKTVAGYFATESYFNFNQQEYIMATYSINYVKETPLSEMDAISLVHIYATKLSLLRKKQRLIFDLLSNGMMVKDIAQHLELAEITVKVAKSRVMVLLGVTTLQEMAVIGRCTSCSYVTPASNNLHIK